MNTDPTLAAVLSDITSVRAWCTRNQGSPAPRQAVEYIAENAEILAFYISALYDGTTQEEREALYAANLKTLDYFAVDVGARGLAESAITEAIQCVGGNELAEVEEDDIVVLLRVLQYVQHINGKHCPLTLRLSPLALP